jgi:hypothetical protein
VTVTGAKHAEKPKDCPLKIFPSTTPDYKWEDIATVKARCNKTLGRTPCIDELKKRVCELGGDTLYSFKDGEDANAIIVIGTVGLSTSGVEIAKTGGEAPKPSAEPAVSQAPASASCDPPCSPGYRCTDGQCLGVCNPPCGEGMRCNQQRTCEATSP